MFVNQVSERQRKLIAMESQVRCKMASSISEGKRTHTLKSSCLIRLTSSFVITMWRATDIDHFEAVNGLSSKFIPSTVTHNDKTMIQMLEDMDVIDGSKNETTGKSSKPFRRQLNDSTATSHRRATSKNTWTSAEKTPRTPQDRHSALPKTMKRPSRAARTEYRKRMSVLAVRKADEAKTLASNLLKIEQTAGAAGRKGRMNTESKVETPFSATPFSLPSHAEMKGPLTSPIVVSKDEEVKELPFEHHSKRKRDSIILPRTAGDMSRPGSSKPGVDCVWCGKNLHAPCDFCCHCGKLQGLKQAKPKTWSGGDDPDTEKLSVREFLHREASSKNNSRSFRELNVKLSVPETTSVVSGPRWGTSGVYIIDHGDDDHGSVGSPTSKLAVKAAKVIRKFSPRTLSPRSVRNKTSRTTKYSTLGPAPVTHVPSAPASRPSSSKGRRPTRPTSRGGRSVVEKTPLETSSIQKQFMTYRDAERNLLNTQRVDKLSKAVERREPYAMKKFEELKEQHRAATVAAELKTDTERRLQLMSRQQSASVKNRRVSTNLGTKAAATSKSAAAISSSAASARGDVLRSRIPVPSEAVEKGLITHSLRDGHAQDFEYKAVRVGGHPATDLRELSKFDRTRRLA